MVGVGLLDQTCVLPKHYVTHIRQVVGQGYKLFVWPYAHPQLKTEVVLTPGLFIEHDSTDVAVMKLLPTNYPLFKDIRMFSMSDKKLHKSLPSTARLLADIKNGVDYILESYRHKSL